MIIKFRTLIKYKFVVGRVQYPSLFADVTMPTLLAFVVISRLQKHESREMKHELTQWKCFFPDTPPFCDHVWSQVDLFNIR